jgi:predicted nucleic-acid-binding protein
LIGIDTNVLVRYFTDDEPRQARAARRLIETRLTRAAPGHVNVVTLAEVAWVLQRLYSAGRDEVARVVDSLLTAPNIVVERKALVRRALQAYAGTPASGFSDCLIAQLNGDAGCETTLTFDKRAAKVVGFAWLS